MLYLVNLFVFINFQVIYVFFSKNHKYQYKYSDELKNCFKIQNK